MMLWTFWKYESYQNEIMLYIKTKMRCLLNEIKLTMILRQRIARYDFFKEFYNLTISLLIIK
jgi:hypothetical protein